jgi:diguanylate cyclase (GGDEF)-like protein/PAS domain S-box-containing protein
MIELGTIRIRDEDSMVQARNKIRQLAEDLKFSPITATRLATVTSELSRSVHLKAKESSIRVGVAREREAFCLQLVFQSLNGGYDVRKAVSVFDSLRSVRGEDGSERVEALKYIPDPGFAPTPDFVATAREKLMRLSRAELMDELTRKNEELKESEALSTGILETAATGIYLLQDGVLQYVNRPFEQMAGYTRDELVGKRSLDFVHPDDREEVRAKAIEVLKGQRSLPYEFRFVRRNSEYIWVLDWVSSIQYQGRRSVLGTLMDITERKRAEEQLRLRENAIENSLNAVAMSDIEGRITYVNKACLRLLGGESKEELLGRNYWDFLQPGPAVDIREIAKSVLETGTWAGEVVGKGKDGRLVNVQVSSSVVRDDQGNPIHTISSFIDVTDRKKAEEALRESEQQYSALVGNLSDAVFLFKNGVIVWCNDRVEQIYGYAKAELLGRSADFFYPADVSPREFVTALYTQIKEHGFYRGTSRFQKKDGSVVYVEFSLSQIPGREAVEIIAVARDVTGRQQAEERTQRDARRMEALYAVAQTVSQTLNMQELLDSALGKVVEVMGADAGGIYLPHEEQRAAELKAYRGTSEEVAHRLSILRFSEEEFQKVLRWTDASTRLSELYSESTVRLITDAMQRDGVKSLVTVPLRVRGELLGVLYIGSSVERAFGVDEMSLITAIGNEIGVGIDNARLLEKTRELSITDELTGLFNRRNFYKVLDGEISRSQRYSGSFSLVMLDLDGFKDYNDTFGHATGDTILKSIAQTIRASLRETDSAFRYGGDEFTLVLPATDAERAKGIVDRLRSRWSQVLDEERLSSERPLGFSVGIAQFPEDAETADGLAFLADTALYHSKRMGGNRSTLAFDLDGRSADLPALATTEQAYALAASVDARDPLAAGHSERVAGLSEMIGRAIGLTVGDLANLRAAALLHDVGKIGIPDSILAKPRRPAELEWKIIKKHSTEGAGMVGHLKELAALAPLIRHHHECYDGTGYPDGLKGDAIPLGARIIGICDAYDTMTTPRVYREVISREAACEELRRCAGTQFDPRIVEAFVGTMNNPA